MTFIGTNLDLLTVGLTTASIGILSFVVYFNNRKSVTNQAFLFFAWITVAWGWINYFNYQTREPLVSLFLTRLTLYFAVWHAFGIFQFFYVYPNESVVFSKFYRFFIRPLGMVASVVALTPLALGQIIDYLPDGRIGKISNGPGMALFGIAVFGFVVGALVVLIRKILKADKQQKIQLNLILTGTVLTFALLLTFNFLLPSVFGKPQYIPYGMVFILPFILFTAYAIIKHGLLNTKVVATELLMFALAVVTFLDVVITKDLWSIIFRVVVFILVLFFSILLIKSVRNEITQREKLQKMTEELTTANLRLQELDRQKTEFLSIASHQLRTPCSILKGYIELIKDGGYGKVTKDTVDILNNMDESNEHLIKLIDEFLNISRIEQGRAKYNFANFDLAHMVKGVVFELKKRAEDKGLKLEWTNKIPFNLSGDEEKIRHVAFNFVDNAIKYTETGAVEINVSNDEGGIKMTVKDGGFGFEKVDEANFFQKFYRGENIKNTNVTGTGLGLYVCKKFIEAHGGKVWAHSPGLGKGSEFGFWLPLKPVVVADEAEIVKVEVTK